MALKIANAMWKSLVLGTPAWLFCQKLVKSKLLHVDSKTYVLWTGGRFPKVTAAKAVICRFSQEQFFGVCQPEMKRDGTPSVGLYVHTKGNTHIPSDIGRSLLYSSGESVEISYFSLKTPSHNGYMCAEADI